MASSWLSAWANTLLATTGAAPRIDNDVRNCLREYSFITAVLLEPYPCSAIFFPTLAFPALISCRRYCRLVRAPAIILSSLVIHHSVLGPWLSANFSLSSPCRH